MDRLPLVAPLLLALGCSGGSTPTPAAPPPGRFEAVPAPAPKAASLDDFCEKHEPAASAPTFAWPELDGPTPAPASSEWTWVNVWATWCGPCVAEMPMLQGWPAKLAADGAKVDLHYLSVDAAAEDVTRFATSHPKIPTGVRVKDYALVAPWLATVGLDAAAVIPIHLFVDPQQKVRCVRMGALEAEDYDTVKRIVSGE